MLKQCPFFKSISLLLFCALLSATSCQKNCCPEPLNPSITYIPSPFLIEQLPSPFVPLTTVERLQDWGKELFLGKAFAREMDLYRALTCFKRALLLIPPKNKERKLEIEYEIFLAYYVANKYEDAITAFESSHLIEIPDDFPALETLTTLLYEAYMQTDQPDKAARLLSLISSTNENQANHLALNSAIVSANFVQISALSEISSHQETVDQFLYDYSNEEKSVQKAKLYNAVLPGAGYCYVGQKKAGLTSFLINALFIAATYQLFDRGYIPAAIITGSLELGWYFGGINGAGLAAQEYNQRLYEGLGKKILQEKRLFPILMINKGF